MVSMPEVVAIQIGPKTAEPTVPRDEVEAVTGKGLVGDRYFKTAGTYATAGKLARGKEVTLIEVETLAAVEREHGISLTFAETRRNVLVRGVALNDLVGREFSIGGVLLRGARLCEPCLKLSQWTKKPLLKVLLNRGGLMASIVEGGILRVGMTISIPSSET